MHSVKCLREGEGAERAREGLQNVYIMVCRVLSILCRMRHLRGTPNYSISFPFYGGVTWKRYAPKLNPLKKFWMGHQYSPPRTGYLGYNHAAGLVEKVKRSILSET
jgi:hypothetical protein